MWAHKGTIEMQITSAVLLLGSPAPADGGGTHTHCAETAVLCFQAICFHKGSACAKKCFDFFFYFSQLKSFSMYLPTSKAKIASFTNKWF